MKVLLILLVIVLSACTAAPHTESITLDTKPHKVVIDNVETIVSSYLSDSLTVWNIYLAGESDCLITVLVSDYSYTAFDCGGVKAEF